MTGTNLERCVEFTLEASGVDEFTTWLYGTCDDDWVGEGDAGLYLELLDVDYRNRYAVIEARAMLRRVIEERDPGFMERVRAAWIAEDLLTGRTDLDRGCNALCSLHYQGVAEVGFEWVSHDGYDALWSSAEVRLAAVRRDARALLQALARVGVGPGVGAWGWREGEMDEWEEAERG